VDASGKLTGVGDGVSTVKATYRGINCQVDVRGFAAIVSGVRVVAVDDMSGLAVQGAKVGLSNSVDGTLYGAVVETNANGVATLAAPSAAIFTVSVLHNSYDWVSLADTSKRDLFVALHRYVPPKTK